MLFTLIFFALSGAVAAQPFDADRYVHVQFVPETIQDMSPRPPGAQVPKKMDMAATSYNAEIHLYYAPGENDYPKFAFGELNVRKQNHQWLRIPLYHEIVGQLSSEEANQTLHMAAARSDVMGKLLNTDNKMPAYEFPPGHTLLLFDSGKVGTPEFLREVVWRHMEGALLGMGTQGHLQVLISMPTAEAKEIKPSRFPMVAQVTYSQIHSQAGNNVAHFKHLEGFGERKALLPAEKEMLEEYFKLHGCDNRLKGH